MRNRGLVVFAGLLTGLQLTACGDDDVGFSVGDAGADAEAGSGSGGRSNSGGATSSGGASGSTGNGGSATGGGGGKSGSGGSSGSSSSGGKSGSGGKGSGGKGSGGSEPGMDASPDAMTQDSGPVGGEDSGAGDSGAPDTGSDDATVGFDASASDSSVDATDDAISFDASEGSASEGGTTDAADSSTGIPHLWVDWTSATNGNPGSATGSISVGDGGTITVTYAGEIVGAQVSGGVDYWVPSTPYTDNGVVLNGPPAADIIRVVGGNATVNTITFSEPVTNPVMAVLSLGQPTASCSYDFTVPFDVLSSGVGFFGGGTFIEEAGDVLAGSEGHGLIQFQGTFTTITWTVPTAENWHGFQIGIPAS